MTQDNSGNQRVTNARLSEKLDHVIEGMDEIKANQKEWGQKIDANTVSCRVHDTLWDQHDKEHSALNTKKWAGDIGAAIAGALTAVGITVAKS